MKKPWEAILDGGQCYIGGKILIHKKLYPDMQLTKQDFLSASICFLFFIFYFLNNGPAEMWTDLRL